jgi:hypothetical protein
VYVRVLWGRGIGGEILVDFDCCVVDVGFELVITGLLNKYVND